jgi:putative membrane protein
MKAERLAPGWAGRVALWTPLGVYAFIWPFGIALLSLGWMPAGAGWVGGALLVAQALGLTAWLALNWSVRRALIAAVLVAGAAWALEAVGVTNGVPFGRYAYTPALGAWLGPVPAAIPFAWIASVGAAWGTARWAWPGARPAITIVLAAALATVQDVILEPVATLVQGYWTWAPAPDAPYFGVPWANFGTWFVAGALLAGAWQILLRPGPGARRYPAVPPALYAMSAIMFGLLNAGRGFGLPALIAGGLLVLLLWRLRPWSVQFLSR